MLCRSSFSLRSRCRGAAAVELAVLLPFLVFVFLVATDFCRLFYYSVVLANCARNGAVYGSNVYGEQSWEGNGSQYTSIQQATLADGSSLNPPLTAKDVTVTNGTDADGQPVVQVTIRYQFRTIANFPGIPSTVNLTRTVQMRVAPASS